MAHIVWPFVGMVDERQIMIDGFTSHVFVDINCAVKDASPIAHGFIVRPKVFIGGVGIFPNEELLCLSTEYNTVWRA